MIWQPHTGMCVRRVAQNQWQRADSESLSASNKDLTLNLSFLSRERGDPWIKILPISNLVHMYICTFHMLLQILFPTLRILADRNAQPGIGILRNSNLPHMYIYTFHIWIQTLFQIFRILADRAGCADPGIRILNNSNLLHMYI